MKMIYKFILLNIIIIALAGCDNKTKFDRVQTFNEYIGFTEYSPKSKNIKKQIINTYLNDSLITIITICADKKGRTTYLNLEDRLLKLNRIETSIDYHNMKFSTEQPRFSISIKDGDVLLDEQDRIIKLLSKDGKDILLNKYENKQLIKAFITSSKLNIKSNYLWKKNLLIESSNNIFNTQNGSTSKIDTIYYYDNDEKIIQAKYIYEYTPNKFTMLTFFGDWNEYGDWTTATSTLKILNQEYNITQTREIKYW